MKKIKLLVIVITIIAGSVFIWRYINNFLYKSKAANEKVRITMFPKSGEIKINEERTVDLVITSQNINKKISGVNLVINIEGGISILGITPPISPGNSNLKVNQLINNVGEKQAHVAYAFTNPSSELSSILQMQLRIKGSLPGSGKIIIDKEKIEISGTVTGNVFEIDSVDEASFSISNEEKPSVSLQILPKAVKQKVGDQFSLNFQIANTPQDKGISAFTVNFVFNPDLLEIINVGDPVDATTDGDKEKFILGKKEINQDKGEIILSYLSTFPQDKLPKKPRVEIEVKGKKPGIGEFKIDFAQVTGNIPENEYQTLIENSFYEIVYVDDVTPTLTVSPIPTITSPTEGGGEDNITFNFKFKFQGIAKKPADQYNKLKVKVTVVSPSGESKVSVGDFVANDIDNDHKGIWTGSVSLNLTPGTGYKILVKGEKHIQKKICHQKPSESRLGPGTYTCDQGEINLQAGDNDLDFSEILLLSGDLPVGGEQDGVVNSADTSFIRNNLGKSDPQTIAIGDINLDGVVNTQDWSLIIAALSVRGDEK